MNVRAYCRSQYITRNDERSSYSFRMHDDMGETIAHGATYCTMSEREQAIQEVLNLAAVAPVVYLGSIVSVEVNMP
ncbi:hypothetical protein BXP70_18000 [Hymenobacter crusticola]|uniref:DUF1508 domain-containing protein n=2 Tax=Hymenobacter crusticola TaxID=1770526 RepID=A0A243WA72_9BACT|nr:hypothetical protein BXP70_18000 [Hymenobacter crusticola]